MNILLATYNFYPFHWGGSEVYVEGLAQYLQYKGSHIRLIAAVDDQAFFQHGLYWSGATLRVCQYTYQGLEIFGVQHLLDTIDIYQKYRPEWEKDWLDFFAYLEQAAHWKPALLHLHGFTAIIGLGLLRAFRKSFGAAPIYASYHTPLSCPKGTLLRWEKNECFIQANVRDCSACSWQAKTSWSPLLAQIGTALLPTKDQPSLPTALRWKALTNHAVQAFGELTRLVDQWWVFSEQIQQVLLAQGVAEQQIRMGRHGIAAVYSSREASLTTRSSNPLIFAYVGRFKRIKGVHTLLRAWLSSPPDPSRQLWLIGDENADAEIQPLLAQARQREDVQLLGPQPANALVDLYGRIHALVVPSECLEIGPLVVHEAVARGANIIASDRGGTRELAQHYAPVSQTFPMGDVSALQACILGFRYQSQNLNVLTQAEHYAQIVDWYPA